MIYKLQTKNSNVTLDPIKQTKGQVILTVEEIIFNGLVYKAKITYSLANGSVIQTTTSTFTKGEADTLYNAFSISGSTFSDGFVKLIKKASSYQLAQSGVLGLTDEDWEEYVAPTYEETPEPTEE